MSKQKVHDKLLREFERAQARFLSAADDPEPGPVVRDDLADYRARALRDVYDNLRALGALSGECELDSEHCELCLNLTAVRLMVVAIECLDRLEMLDTVQRELG